jgi:hypothetical protein
MPPMRDRRDNLRIPASLDTYAKIYRVRELFLHTKELTLANRVDIRTVLREFSDHWVPDNAWLHIRHINVIKYPLQSFFHSGYRAKLWVMRLGMPFEWQFFGLDKKHVHIAGCMDNPGIGGDYGFGCENWRTGNFVRRHGNDVGSSTGDDQATLLGGRAEAFIILNDRLLQSLEMFVTTWLPAHLYPGQTTVHDSESESDN